MGTTWTITDWVRTIRFGRSRIRRGSRTVQRRISPDPLKDLLEVVANSAADPVEFRTSAGDPLPLPSPTLHGGQLFEVHVAYKSSLRVRFGARLVQAHANSLRLFPLVCKNF